MHSSEPGLFKLAEGNEEVRNICKRIGQVLETRNNFTHGLITTAVPESGYRTTKLRRGDKSWELRSEALRDLKIEMTIIIEDLNSALPVKGVYASLCTGMDEVDVSYTRAALEEYGMHLESE